MTAKKTAWASLAGMPERYRMCILAGILAFISLPPSFTLPVGNGLDSSWMRALNLAVKNHRVFGKEFIFTYGPLGFLSTRNVQYFGNGLLLAGDLFLAAGIFYILYKVLMASKGWAMILFMAVFIFKGAHYSEGLYLAFIVFVLMNLKNNFNSYFELGYCGLAGILLFFIKVNYGIIALLLLVALMVSLLFKNWRAFAVFLPVMVLLFWGGCALLHVSVPGYIISGAELIKNYDEAMGFEIEALGFPYLSAVAMLLVLFGFLIYCLVNNRKMISAFSVASVILLCLSGFLFYKNAFTRSEYGHNASFFSVFPLFIAAAVYITGFTRYELSKTAASLVILISSVHFVLPQFDAVKHDFDRSYVNPMVYLKGIFEKQIFASAVGERILDGKKGLIGNSTIDIFPYQIASLMANDLNYCPRPVPQSYTVYSGYLDSVNEGFFCSTRRPELLLMRNESTDGRYAFWDESVTKAAIHLNYEYLDQLAFNQPLWQNGKYTALDYILLKAKKAPPRYPVFEKIGDQVIGIEERVAINFPDSVAVYMAVDMDYNALGLLLKYVYEPPPMSITLYPEAPVTLDFRIVRPIARNPVLINKFVGSNADLKNFMSGNLKLNNNIRGFMLHTGAPYFKPRVKASFYRFTNY